MSVFAEPLTFRDGRIQVDVAARTVTVDGRGAKLSGRAFDVLEALIRRRDRVVPKQELMEVVWPGLIVEENNLQVHVMSLRRILGSDAIVTSAGRGYRFALGDDAKPAPSQLDIAPRGVRSSTPRTTLIGREPLLAKTCAMLRRPSVRLVTLSGPGGSGKTRIGLRITAELAHDFPDGSYVVMLAPLRDAAHVAATIAGVLGIQQAGSSPIEDLLIAWLQQRALLLALDNFEHLSPAAALVARLLDSCPKLKILVTSRALLGIPHEQDVKVPPLPVPEYNATPSQALQSPAVRLFMERAQATGFPPGEREGEIDAVIDICRHLDGLPLAIELATARLRVLSVSALAKRLRGSLRLLAGGGRNVPARQRTLHDAIAWSYGLLAANEQAFFRALSVFVGGWTLESVEAVMGDNALDALSALIDHSLVQRIDDPQGETRYAMLETIREFAAEMLARNDGEATDLRDRHAAHYLDVAEAIEPRLCTGQRGPWISRLRSEYNNVRAALSWTIVEKPDVAAALRLTGALHWFWYFSGLLSEGRAWISLALALPGAQAPQLDLQLAKVLTGMGRLAWYSSDAREAADSTRRAIEIYRAHGNRRELALPLIMQGIVQIVARDVAGSDQTYREATECFREAGDEWGLAMSMTYHGSALVIYPGTESAARPLIVEGRARFRALGDEWGMTTSSHYLGSLAMREGDFVTAREMTEEMLANARELGDAYRVARNLHQLAEIAFAEGNAELAFRHLRDSLALNYEQGRAGDVRQQLRFLARVEMARGHPENSIRLYAAAESFSAKGSSMPPDDPRVHEATLAMALEAVGELRRELIRAEGAAMSYDQVVAWARSVADASIT